MKKIVYFVLFLFSSLVFSQNGGISYQAVIYAPGGQNAPGVNVTNVPMVNKSICLQFSFIDASDMIEYREEVTLRTDEFGMVNITIGQGTQTAGYASNFQNIVWSTVLQKKLQVELDPTGLCNQFEEISNQPIAFVPFANAASTAGNVSGVVALQNGGTGATNANDARANLSIDNVDNTSDLNKPISTDTQTALDLKENTVNKSTSVTLGNSDDLYPTQNAVKTYVDTQVTSATIADADATTKGKIQLAGDLGGTAALPTVPGLANKENAVNKSATTTLGTSDVLFPTQNAVKTYVDTNITAVNNATSALQATVTANATAATTAVAAVQADVNQNEADSDAADVILQTNIATLQNTVTTNATNTTASLALKEDVVNKSATTALGTSDDLYPTQNAVKTYVDAQVASATIADADATTKGKIQLAGDLGGTAALPTVPGLATKENVSNKSTTTTLGTSDDLYPTQNAVKTYVDAQVASATIADADATTKGKIQLAGDLTGTAAAPEVAAGKITTAKLADDAVTSVKIKDGEIVNDDISSLAGIVDTKLATISTPGKVSNSATTASTLNNSNSIILRDDYGGFSAGNITASGLNSSGDIVVNGLNIGTPGGSQNTRVGNGTFVYASAIGNNNTALGNFAFTSSSGNSNTAIGSNAIRQGNGGSGDFNTAVGESALSNAQAGNKNTGIGVGTLNPTTGAENTAIGYLSGNNVTTGSSNTFLGSNANAQASFGTISNSTAIGAEAIVNESNTIQLGNTAVTNVKTAAKLTTGAVTYPNVDGSANQVLFTNGSGVASFGPIPLLNQNTTGTASNVTGTVAIANGGTGATVAADALTNLGAQAVANLSTDMTADATSITKYPAVKTIKDYVDSSVTSGAPDATTITKGKVQLAGDLTGTAAAPEVAAGKITTAKLADDAVETIKIKDANVTYAKIQDVSATDKVLGRVSAGAGVIEEIATTGSGDVVRATSPTLVTPDLGTPSALVLTSATGLPLTTGVTGILPEANGGTGSATKNFVDLTTNQTIGGNKVFTSNASFNGQSIGKGNATGGENLAVGAGAMNAVSTGVRNTAIGNSAMLNYEGTSFDNNTSVGYSNLVSLTTGSGNTSVGAESMLALTTGTSNTSIGNQSLINTTGSNNVGVGKSAGNLNSTGNNNTIIGTDANLSANNLNNASALGYGATVATSNTIQLGNTDVTSVNTSGKLTTGAVTYPNTDGSAGQVLLTNGSGEASFGPIPTLNQNTTGTAANVTGTVAIANGGTGSTTQNFVDLTTAQTIAGVKTFSDNLDVKGIIIGNGANGVASNTSIGKNSLVSNTVGINNVAIGEQAGYSITGSNNVAIGTATNRNATEGDSNISIGNSANYQGTSGANNISLGTLSYRQGNSGSNNVALGTAALYNEGTGSDNVAIGNESNKNGNGASGNITIGYRAGDAITTGNNNLILGYNADVTNGSFTNATAIGNGASVNASNTIQLGNTAVTNVKTSGAITSTAGITGTQLTSTVATGTAPLVVTSTTPVANLNIGGNAATVTTNANLTGDVTSTGNATTIVTDAVTSAKIKDGEIMNDDINASAGIVDTKLATIATAGKVSNSATTATDANTASAIVARDANGDFAAGTITAALSGNATTATTTTNIAGGAAGSLPYQSATDTTAMLAKGTDGQVLVLASGVPKWSNNIGGGVLAKTDSYDILATDSANLLVFSGSAASKTIKLPSATTVGAGREITIKNIASVSVAVSSTSGNLISDNTTTTATSLSIGIEPSNNWIKAISDGTNWIILRALF